MCIRQQNPVSAPFIGHRSELQHSESSTIEAGPRLGKKNRHTQLQADPDRHQSRNRKPNRSTHQQDKEI
jgi:hypothetical protein